MTNGQLMFYAGIGLFGLTILLAIVFLIKKPKYRPENASVGGGQTIPLRNGYPTEPMTVRYGAADRKSTETNGHVAEITAAANGTVLLEEENTSLAAETELLVAETELLPPETQLLPPETQLLSEGTALLK
ncbi:MAG: hypothetical protein E7445_02180 [Ruminococcaceae bacterium]|nr:hypothetical protein [Oscillospiraceae bacterium]